MSIEKIRWYSVTEKLPDDNETVLLFGTIADPVERGYYSAGEWLFDDDSKAAPQDGISHWAALPLGPCY